MNLSWMTAAAITTVLAYDALLTEVACDGCVIQGSDDASFTDLDRDGEPEVIVTGYTAGNSCCATMGLYDYDEVVRNWGSSGFEIVAADTRFEERFGPAATSFPLLDRYGYR